MKTRTAIIALATLLLCFGFSTIIYQYNFSSPTFPPPGWSVETTGSGGSWIWTDSEPPGNGYAHGTVNLTNPLQTGSATLITNDFSYVAGQDLNILFMYRASWTGAVPSNYAWQEILRIGTTPVITHNLYSSPNYPQWHQFSNIIMSGILESSSEYNLAIKVTGSYGSNPSLVYFDVDDLLITTGPLGVEPASLGQIKANYTR